MSPRTPRPGRRAQALERLGASFKASMASVRRLRGRETHRPGELSYAQYSLLFGLAHGGALSLHELAAGADLSPATATGMLDSLAAAGLVRRERSTTDRRIVLTALTERGEAVIAARREQFEPRWRAALAGVSDRDLLIAADVLERLRGFFDGLAEAGETGAGADPPAEAGDAAPRSRTRAA